MLRRRPVAPWRRLRRGVCPGCKRVVGAGRVPRTGNLLLLEHHRPRTHVVCEPTDPTQGVVQLRRWYGVPA